MQSHAIIFLFALVLSSVSSSAWGKSKGTTSAEEQALTTLKNISSNVQKLKEDVVVLNKDLKLMEETLLFPSSTKYSVFVSLSSGQFFTLESVKLKIDGKLVVTHVYSENQRQALSRGGIQKLYVTNLNEGKHNATAFFTGVGPSGRAYKLAKTLDFEKGSAGEYLELAIGDDGSAQEPIVRIKQW
ncbi:AraC family transcriptional regulator [Pleionea sp. CnH1-48]|uniref:AraC family transcriptional regulator n=1 Tax=Pleionea sp. CnH1-48 TaxID=2954494 RepID=UPI002096FED5|nr:AraC family transcriptional regulator [Pleionea sp. CnH1-48]MCO7223238.1 AraC family transcriptional regulator [Pleionea sp. CnH1-48]